MAANLRDVLHEIRTAGLEVASVTLGRHIKVRVRRMAGDQTRLFVAASTPSDWRSQRNDRGVLRRLAREMGAAGK